MDLAHRMELVLVEKRKHGLVPAPMMNPHFPGQFKVRPISIEVKLLSSIDLKALYFLSPVWVLTCE